MFGESQEGASIQVELSKMNLCVQAMEEEATKLLNLSDRLYVVQKGMSSSGEYQEISMKRQ